MGAVVHGRPGQSLRQSDEWRWSGTANARRGAFFEERVAQVLHLWLASRPDEVHVFHDLVGLNNITGAGLEPISLGGSNIDHLILTGGEWLMIDAKGCGAGSLRVEAGKGVLVRSDGSRSPQPWMDDQHAYSHAGVPFRLTNGKGGAAIWVVPHETSYDHPSVPRARFLSRKGAEMCLLNDSEIAAGALDEVLPSPAQPVDLRDVDRLHPHVSAPDILYRL
ncbi:nuclease-related domain-containing protein [Prauserella endophytica]|uniref:nuclease-related domain-containing protein n=1 Tax=Prauserella endophytica TaxID=1592324 RepID=UPI0013053300|nr:nuclease-related domain-containing protein [Prauserella endophytica]